MNSPLIITDANGNLLCSNHSVKISGALLLMASTAAKNNKSGIVYCDGKAFYTKEIMLCSKRFRFFIDSEERYKYLGVDALSTGEAMFDLGDKFKQRISVSLRSLVSLFADAFAKELHQDGVKLSIRGIVTEHAVNVSPNAFALCLALIARLSASNASEVTLTFANERGRISVYADSVGGEPIETEQKEVLQTLLYEVCAAADFKVERRVIAQKESFCLCLEPLDISLLGFKVPTLDKYQKLFMLYIKLFL